MHQPAPGPRPIPTKVRTIPMSQKRNRKARSQALKPVIAASPNPARLSLAVPDEEVLDDPEWAEMGANDTDFQISTLTFRQQSALPAIAMASTITQAARDSGIGKTTLHRWLQEPEFRQQLANYRQESADLARQQAQALSATLSLRLRRSYGGPRPIPPPPGSPLCRGLRPATR